MKLGAEMDESTLMEDEEKQRVELNTELRAGSPPRSLGVGELSVTTRRLLWQGQSALYAVWLKDIAMHAIARDESAFDKPCLYCQVRGEPPQLDGESEGAREADEEEEKEEEEEATFEMRVLPATEGSLDDLYRAVTAVAEMNPSESESGSEDEGGSDGVDWDAKLVAPSDEDEDEDEDEGDGPDADRWVGDEQG